MAYKIKILEPAEEDALDYVSYIKLKEHSNEPAERWLKGLYLLIRSLHELPQRFPVIAEADKLGKEYRFVTYYSHRIIYEVDEPNKVVLIHRIYHGARHPLSPSDIPPMTSEE